MLPTIGPGPNDRHLHHDVVKLLRPQSRQTRHLRAAFHLEQADRVGLLQRFINRRVVLRKMRQINFFSVSVANQVRSSLPAPPSCPGPADRL